jgi:hypothetical protein
MRLLGGSPAELRSLGGERVRAICERCGLAPHIPHSDADDCIRSLRVALQRAEGLAAKRGGLLARSEKRAETWRAKTEQARGLSQSKRGDPCHRGAHEERIARLELMVEGIFEGRQRAA